jgi:hypothetical protein
MAYLRFSRDKRGYEQFALIQQTNNRRGANRSRPRLLYWFRTPPNVKVGREPFDADVRRLLESRNPGIVFDWDAIVTTPIPPVEVENWRERRRAERAARQAANAPDPSDVETPDVPQTENGADADARANDVVEPAGAAAESAVDRVVDDVETTTEAADEASRSTEQTESTAVNVAAGSQQPQPPGSGRRRRRRRRRRGGNQTIREVGQVTGGHVVPDGEPEPGNSDGEV